MIWKFLKQNVLFPKGLNWVQHWVSRLGLLSILSHCDWYTCSWIFLSACDSVLVQWKNGKATWTERHSGGKWHSAKIWVIICLSILFTTICTWIILQILKASEFFMLDSLKRRCECLAADYLDCDNVLDTYTFAKVKDCLRLRWCRCVY